MVIILIQSGHFLFRNWLRVRQGLKLSPIMFRLKHLNRYHNRFRKKESRGQIPTVALWCFTLNVTRYT